MNMCAFAKEKYCVSLSIEEKRERAHKYLYTEKKVCNKRKKKQNLFSCCSPIVLEMKLDFDAHEKRNKQEGNYL
jgi:hypothetical protein